MSVMTAGEQKRRAGSARGRRLVTAVPGQPNVMAGPWPGAGERHGRAAPGERHGRAVPPGERRARTEVGERHGRAAPGQRRARTEVGERHGRTAHGAPGRASRAGAAGAPQPPLPTPRIEAGLPPARPPAPRSPVTRPAHTRVRLTRRGRIVVAGLAAACMVLVAALAWLAGTAKASAAGSGVPSSAVYHSLRSVTVLPGQSLWSIATQYEPGSDPRNVIQEIVDLNALSGTAVQPGEHLWLPRG
jgi:LysM domain